MGWILVRVDGRGDGVGFRGVGEEEVEEELGRRRRK